ncbi:MAG: hypothetical protein ACP5SH_02475, partial [Syntrophobacteraceae bacterium]
MKKFAFALVAVVVLAGGMITAASSPSFAQDYGYDYPPPPADIYAQPWVGPDTPWVYYNGDWFLDGVLYYYFGPGYGWAPYYAYPYTNIIRPGDWYSPRWSTWYHGHPTYWQSFLGHYPYWRTHREGQRYNRSFYERHNRGQGPGWQKGFHHPAGNNRRPQMQNMQRPGSRPPQRPANVRPPSGRPPQMPAGQRPQMQHMQPPAGQRPQMQHMQPP